MHSSYMFHGIPMTIYNDFKMEHVIYRYFLQKGCYSDYMYTFLNVIVHKIYGWCNQFI